MIELQFRGRTVVRDHALVMAIINRTPDSFYDKGATYAEDVAMEAVHRVVDEGADIVDIGGVKAGPGDLVDSDEEVRRVVPFIARVREAYPDLIISSDTWRADVGRLACEAGADLLNDTWAGADPHLAEVAAEYGAGYVCSHTGGVKPRTRPHRVSYPDLVADVIAETTAHAERVVALGVPRKSVLIDPTHDFGKNTWHSLALVRHTDALVATGWPVLMALSNKDFVGETLGVELHERVEGTLVATAIAALAGAAVFRAHEVARTRRVLESVARLALEV
ncbi:dihydropteroate synthase [Lentzea rhizosphaerae]|uniref:Dihydropteroate synthase n=1 Tax=Lentzea rhizosphaerae TaxID=2041025 RepID=A0ABV8C3I0_9PSEU|nr:dihydropteroate synthase [Lentzea aerocolonigenes]MCP2246335.1 dihydropteroate synthase [Lentzea aerocolonigenes]